MRRAAGVYWRPICTGVGFGLVSGLVGVVQWVLTQLDLIERVAAFNAFLQTHPDAWDADTVVWGNHVYWFCSAAVAGFPLLGPDFGGAVGAAPGCPGVGDRHSPSLD